MSVTAQAVLDMVAASLPDTGKWSPAEKLALVNAAIYSAWPRIKSVAVDTSQTFDSTTYEYTPTAVPEVEWGFSEAYATYTGMPDIPLSSIRQRQSGTSWIILVPASVASNYNDQTLKLRYNARVPAIVALAGTIELPMDYLWKATAYFMAINALTQSSKVDSKSYEPLVTLFQQEMQKSLLANARGDLVGMPKGNIPGNQIYDRGDVFVP